MRVIENETEYAKVLIRIDYLMSKKDDLTIDEQEELNNLSDLVDRYEDENYPYPPVD